MPGDVTAFAWSAPLRELAKRIGTSDVGLKKLLNARGISTPPQGHWNRVKAGRVVPGPPRTAPRGPGENGRVQLDSRFRVHVAEAPPISEYGPFASPRVPEELGDLFRLELGAIGKVAAPRDLSRPAAGLARLLRREEERRTKAAETGWSYHRPRFDGPLEQRQLRVLCGILTALARRGHEGEVEESEQALRLSIVIGDTILQLRFELANEKSKRPGDRGTARPGQVPVSSPLRLVLEKALPGEIVTSWTDEGGLRLENQLAAIAAGIVVAGEAAFRRGLAEAREWAEQVARWDEERRLERIARLEEKRLADLATSGRLLREAEEIRRLVVAVEGALKRGTMPGFTDEVIDRWTAWALRKADSIDPVLSGQVLSHLHVPDLDDPLASGMESTG